MLREFLRIYNCWLNNGLETNGWCWRRSGRPQPERYAFPIPLGPSPNIGQIGFYNCTFEACSRFTRVMSCQVAATLKFTFFPRASAKRSPCLNAWVATGMYRQFPGRDFHPMVICALVAHQHIGVDQFSANPASGEGSLHYVSIGNRPIFNRFQEIYRPEIEKRSSKNRYASLEAIAFKSHSPDLRYSNRK